jgi:hypothetical protein
MRDRLRAVSCPSEMIHQIGGWSSGKIGEGYGKGFRAKTNEFMYRIIRYSLGGTLNADNLHQLSALFFQ